MLLRNSVSSTLSQAFSALFLLATFSAATAQEHGAPFDCEPIVDGVRYDLTGLKGLQLLGWEVHSPPSRFIDELRFDLCGMLHPVGGRSGEDQCPSGTVACLTKINRKGSERTDRITAVIPVAHVSSLDPEISHLSSSEGLSIVLHGPLYPSSPSNLVPQSLKVNLACAESSSSPLLASYENGQVTVEWSSRSACKAHGQHPSLPSDEKEGSSEDTPGDVPIEHVGSGLGFFFLMLLLALCAYAALGAYRNYSVYGARGLDLIPHRDFWREVPYLLQDVVHHLCSNVRPRQPGRRGYVTV
ncbi:autophagy-related protein 27 [Pisolithus thermaeus]|nr:autophagy-related protein 27 [Pisolithus thermaeus]